MVRYLRKSIRSDRYLSSTSTQDSRSCTFVLHRGRNVTSDILIQSKVSNSMKLYRCESTMKGRSASTRVDKLLVSCALQYASLFGSCSPSSTANHLILTFEISKNIFLS